MKKLVLIILLPANLFAQSIENSEKEVIITSFKKLVSEKFISVDKVNPLMDSIIYERYIQITDRKLFLSQLNKDIFKIAQDRHLRVEYDPIRAVMLTAIISDGKQEKKQKSENYGFGRLQILPGNIGYFELNYFADTLATGQILSSSFNFLKNTDYIILDLRSNIGGSKTMMQLVASYLLPKQAGPLITITDRSGKSLKLNTLRTTFFKDLSEKKVFILTSANTFSAAEGLSFILKNRKRAILVGDKTAGGGNTVGFYPVLNKYVWGISEGKVVDPLIGKGWEQTGVQPDTVISSAIAFEKAYVLALSEKQNRISDSSDLFKINWKMGELNSIISPLVIDTTQLKNYEGTYGKRVIHAGEGRLWYQAREDAQKAELIPITETLFRFREIDFFRILFKKDKEGNIIGLFGFFENGTDNYNEKNN